MTAQTPATPATPEDLFRRLDDLGIAYANHTHPPVFTVEESRALRGDLPGGHCKNLFLRDKKRNLWLVVADEDLAVDLKALRGPLGSQGTLSFGRPDLLMEVLGVVPGAVTPFALINDTAQRVTVILDARMLEAEVLNYHPLDNAQTTAIRPADLVAFIRACGHDPRVMDFAAPA